MTQDSWIRPFFSPLLWVWALGIVSLIILSVVFLSPPTVILGDDGIREIYNIRESLAEDIQANNFQIEDALISFWFPFKLTGGEGLLIVTYQSNPGMAILLLLLGSYLFIIVTKNPNSWLYLLVAINLLAATIIVYVSVASSFAWNWAPTIIWFFACTTIFGFMGKMTVGILLDNKVLRIRFKEMDNSQGADWFKKPVEDLKCCPYCGNTRRVKGAKKCGKCGNSLIYSSLKQAGDKSSTTCIYCNQKIPDPSRFCWHCGKLQERDLKHLSKTTNT